MFFKELAAAGQVGTAALVRLLWLSILDAPESHRATQPASEGCDPSLQHPSFIRTDVQILSIIPFD